jgi:hypothetical protein
MLVHAYARIIKDLFTAAFITSFDQDPFAERLICLSQLLLIFFRSFFTDQPNEFSVSAFVKALAALYAIRETFDPPGQVVIH